MFDIQKLRLLNRQFDSFSTADTFYLNPTIQQHFEQFSLVSIQCRPYLRVLNVSKLNIKQVIITTKKKSIKNFYRIRKLQKIISLIPLFFFYLLS